MKKIVNDILPWEGFTALTIWPFVFVRRDLLDRYDDKAVRHERIHGLQQKEMLLIGFYLWYGIEYLLRLAKYRNKEDAYFNVSFEQEAYMNQADGGYLRNRKWYAWTHYLRRRSFRLSQKISDRI
jgi:hypothetical protein